MRLPAPISAAAGSHRVLLRDLAVQEASNERRHLIQLVFEREMSRVDQMELSFRKIAQIGMRAFFREIWSFLPQTTSVGGLRLRKKAWNCG